MKRCERIGIFGLAVLFLVAFAGCKQASLSGNASLESIKVAGVSATLGTPAKTWSDAIAGAGEVYLAYNQLADAAVEVACADKNAEVYYASAKPGVTPSFAQTSTFSFDSYDVVFIEVFSESHDVFNVYAVTVIKKTPVIKDITLAGRSASGGTQTNGVPIQQFGTGLGKPGASWNDTAISEGSVWFGSSQANTALALVVSPEVSDTTYQYAVTADGTTEPSFVDSAASMTITPTDGKYLYLKSTNASTEAAETAFYKIKLVQKKDSLGLSSVSINGVTAGIGVMGTSSFPGNEYYGSYSKGAELATNGSGYVSINKADPSVAVVVTAVAADPSIAISYSHTTTERNYLLSFSDSNNLGTLPNNEFIALQVVSEIGEKGWYKFRIRTGNDEAVLTAVTFNSEAITLPVAGTAWNASLATVAWQSTLALPLDTTVGITGASRMATVTWGTSASATTAPTTWSSAVLSQVSTGTYIGVRVVSENLGVTTYYRFQAAYGNKASGMSAITFNGDSVSPVAATSWAAATALEWKPASKQTQAVIGGTPEADTAVRYGTSSDNATAPTNWASSATISNLLSNTWIGIEVTSQDKTNIQYYKVRYLYGSNATPTFSGVTVGGVAPSGLGTVSTTAPTAKPADTSAGAISLTLDQTKGDVVFADVLANTTVEYGVASMVDMYPAYPGWWVVWTMPTAWRTTGPAADAGMTAGQYLTIRAYSEDRTVVNYYLVKVAIQ
jgi:hypothetical protein